MLSDRLFWGFLLISLLLTACQPADAGEVARPDEPAAIVENEAEASPVQVIVPANDFSSGQPRVPFVFYDGLKQIADVKAVEIVAFDLSGETPDPVWQGPAANYSDYEIPYWVVYPDLPSAGFWGLQAQLTLADGDLATANFAIETLAAPAGPDLGEPVPPSQNRTTQDYSLDQLSSAVNPDPKLYHATVSELIAAGRPAVIQFSTPAFCQTAICAPVLDTLEAVYPAYDEQIDFLHLEIYKEFDPLVVADEVTEWNLPSEPWTFVIDRDGLVVARLAGPISPAELTPILDRLIESGAS